MVFQEDNGKLDWQGRYSMFDRRLQEVNKMSSGFRKISKHKFMITSPSKFKIYINTLGSDAKVRV